MILFRFVTALLFLVTVHTASAADSAADLKRKVECIELVDESTATIETRDWPRLKQLSERYIKTCKNIFSAEGYSEAYGKLALANNSLGNAHKALVASDKCISTFYANPACHMERVMALIKLERLSDAKSALEKTDRLIKHVSDSDRRKLKGALTASEIELLKSRMYHWDELREYASAIRKKYFPE